MSRLEQRHRLADYLLTLGPAGAVWVCVFVLVGDTGIEPVTSSVSRKRSPTELIARGGSGNRTRVQGFAGPCLSHSAIPPPAAARSGSAKVPAEPRGSRTRDGVRHLRADDGIRTRDPHLGKVMLYQLSHVRIAPLSRAVCTAGILVRSGVRSEL